MSWKFIASIARLLGDAKPRTKVSTHTCASSHKPDFELQKKDAGSRVCRSGLCPFSLLQGAGLCCVVSKSTSFPTPSAYRTSSKRKANVSQARAADETNLSGGVSSDRGGFIVGHCSLRVVNAHFLSYTLLSKLICGIERSGVGGIVTRV